jgi:hypothetical protein
VRRLGTRRCIADKLYQEEKFIAGLRQRKIAPHVAEYEKASLNWPNFLNETERNHAGFAISQKKRKLVERIFGWGKLDSIMRKFKLRGVERIDWVVSPIGDGQQSGAHGEAEQANSGAISAGRSVSAGLKQALPTAKSDAERRLNSTKMTRARNCYESNRLFQQPLQPCPDTTQCSCRMHLFPNGS